MSSLPSHTSVNTLDLFSPVSNAGLPPWLSAGMRGNQIVGGDEEKRDNGGGGCVVSTPRPLSSTLAQNNLR